MGMGASITGLRGAMKAGLGATLGLVFPPQCLGCGAGVAETGALCPECWRETEFVGPCACGRCGVPLPGDAAAGDGDGDGAAGDGAAGDAGTGAGTGQAGGWEGAGWDAGDWDAGTGLLCDTCMAVARPWRRGRAALVYAGTGRRLVLALKHGDRLDLAPALGQWLATAARPLVKPGMIVVPVPLHPRRMLARKYNQAALLAERVARVHGLRHLPTALARVRHTPMQDHGSVSDRHANLDGALAVPARARAAVEGRAVLLIDDVMASGATLAAATDALRDAGSGPVAVAVLARAILPEPGRGA